VREWLRKIRGDMSKSEAARKAGISRQAYSNIERGVRNPSVKTAKQIAKAFGFDWVRFFENDKQKGA
jgi:Predicted transcriptional regulators